MLKKIMSLLIILTVAFTYYICISAHAYFYTGAPPYGTAINLNWTIKYNNKAYLRCSDDSIGWVYLSAFPTGLFVWNDTCGNDVYLYDSPSDTATVHLWMPMQYTWIDKFGENAEDFAGYTEVRDTAGNWITSVALAQNSTKQINWAQIYLNPIPDVYGSLSFSDKIKLIGHELGHALCLGHSNGDFFPTTMDSIMKKMLSDDTTYPQQHDINEIAAKY